MIELVRAILVLIVIGFAVPGKAQQLPPEPTNPDTQAIPGGVLKVHNVLTAAGIVEDVTLSVNHHVLRAYWASRNEDNPVKSAPPVIFADNHPLIVGDASLPRFEAVLTGGGRTYVRVTQGVDETHPPNLWIVDASAAKVAVTRRIVGCIPAEQAVADGAYVLTCTVNGENRTVVHRFKDGLLK